MSGFHASLFHELGKTNLLGKEMTSVRKENKGVQKEMKIKWLNSYR